jgi:hypothetical protein
MRKHDLLRRLTCGITIFVTAAGASAETHVITTKNFNWSYKGQASQLIRVDDLKVGDIIDVQIAGAIPHGFTTIKKDPPPIVAIDDPVIKCGEADSAKPNAVLREIECAEKSRFGLRFVGSMKLEVLPKFSGEVPFWCVVHTAGMQGILKLQPAQ